MNDRYLYRAKTRLIVGTYNFGKEDGEWVKGYLYCDTGRWMIKQFEFDRANYIDYEVDPSTICQCTGLKDKNGKLIWENDIVKKEFYTDYDAFANSEEYIGVVKYEDCAWCVSYERNGCKCNSPIFMAMEYHDAEHFDVIGNIFDEGSEHIDEIAEQLKKGGSDAGSI